MPDRAKPTQSMPPLRPGRGRPGFSPSEKPKNSKKTVKRLLKYFKNERKTVVCLFVTVILSVICSVAAPSLQSKAIDSVSAGNFSSVGTILIEMLCVYIFYSLMNLLQARLSAILSQSIIKRMRLELFDKIIHLPVRYIDSHPHGDIMSRMTNDVENISNTVSQSLSSLFSGVLTVLGTVAMMIWYSPLLALLSCVTVILTVVVTKYLSKAMRKFFVRRQELLGELNACVEETVTGYKTLTAYNRQDESIKNLSAVSDSLTKTGIKAEILGGSMGPVMNVINNIGFVIIAGFGGWFAVKGLITIGVISAFIVYAKQFGRPINEIAQLYGQIQTAAAGAERVFEILDEKTEDIGGNSISSDSRGVVEFRNVDFSYIPGKQVLFDFNLKVQAGHKVALVGATGSGKTTVVNLLTRFYDADSGEILIDGVNIKDMNLSALRKKIGIVLQDTVLFSDTLKNNLKYGDETADDEKMKNAAELANCDKMIEHLPDGYDTVLSYSGENLSQGQRQLLTIARAFLADPDILILDEATSSVDTRTEKKIQDAMVTLMKERTSLIIAHRLSTVRDADLIVVLDKGRITEQGNHDSLIARRGRYYELYMTQFSGKEI